MGVIIEKNGKKYDLDNYSCEFCKHLDDSRPWTGYGKCEILNMVVELDNACRNHSLITGGNE